MWIYSAFISQKFYSNKCILFILWCANHSIVNLFTSRILLLILYYLPHNSFDASSDKKLFNNLYFSLFSSVFCLILYRYRYEKLLVTHGSLRVKNFEFCTKWLTKKLWQSDSTFHQSVSTLENLRFVTRNILMLYNTSCSKNTVTQTNAKFNDI